MGATFFIGNFVKLWEKGVETDEVMHRLTVGRDPRHDLNLLRWDCIGSAAQAKILHRAGILSNSEVAKLLESLQSMLARIDSGEVTIPDEHEDCHTTLEVLLTKEAGEAGKKIHTGRSRNDQVITAVRLYLRNLILEWSGALLCVAERFSQKIIDKGDIPMPGYTHLQPAMPATIGMWLHAFLEGVLELTRDGLSLYTAVNRNPLGASAGFGSSLPLDREYGATLLGFDCAQRSFIDIQNSRGRYEEKVLFWAVQVGSIFEKFAWDVELYCTKEFGFFTLPDSLTTGSSIMPQKKNPDIVELLRGRCGLIRGFLSQLQWVTGKLPSNYHRDLQLTKGPLFSAVKEVENIFTSVNLIVDGLQIDEKRLDASMHDELFATYAAYRKVKEGKPFRDAYKETALEATSGKITRKGYESEMGAIKAEVALYIQKSHLEKSQLEKDVGSLLQRQSEVLTAVFNP